MPKSLVITEKPSVARDIAAALGGFEDHEGWSENERWVITFAVGHLFELLAPEDLDPKYKRWLLSDLPIEPETFRFKPKSGHSERIRTIKKLLERPDVDEVVNACDAGREGELIFREIMMHFGVRKPVRRLWLQSMTEDAIRDGFARLLPGEEKEGLGQAAECRAYSDWLIGMNATRALTKRLKSRKETTAWSAGRVQTPTLALLVERELVVLAHRPRPYWRVIGRFAHREQEWTGTYFDADFREGSDAEAKDDRLFDEARAASIVAAVQAAAAGSAVRNTMLHPAGSAIASETRRPSRESAPPLFDLTSLQREGNRRFSWSAKRTLGAAQRCYEQHKILTYPRTDSRCLPSDYRQVVDRVLGELAHAGGALAPEISAGARRLIESGRENDARIFDDGAVSDHFAIIPTGVLPGAALSNDDRRLYDLVVRRFLGAFHPPAIWEQVERTARVGEHRFRTRARTLTTPGWRAVLPPADEGAEDVRALPALGEGDVAVDARGAELEANETKPPARITEARLLSLMENAGDQIEDEDLAAVLHEKGIGTPATRADIIENLIAKGYVVRVGKALRPTVKGIRLIQILTRIHVDRLASAKLTGEIESHLLDVERRRRTADDFMREMKDYAREIVGKVSDMEFERVYPTESPLGSCPRCGRPVYERSWFYRCLEDPAAGDDDCTFRIWKDISGRYIDPETARALLAGDTGVLDGFTARNGRTYRGRLEIDRETWAVKVRSEGPSDGEAASDVAEYEVDPEPLGPCPHGDGCRVVETPTQFLCERKRDEAEKGKDESAPKSCGFVLPRTVCKREITRAEALVYVQNRKTDLLTDFTSRFGRPFSATLVLKENGRHGFEFPPRAAGAGARGGRGRGRAAADEATSAAGTGEETASAEAPKRKPARRTSASPARKAAARTATRRSAGASAKRGGSRSAKPAGEAQDPA